MEEAWLATLSVWLRIW